MGHLVYKELSYLLTGLFFKIHKKLGRFCREIQYCDTLEYYLKETGVIYEREMEIKKLNTNSPKGNRIDYLIEQKIIVDIKAKPFITKEDYRQMQRYLQSSNMELGMIVNFRNVYLKPKRILNTKLFHSEHSDVYSDH